MQTDSNTNPSTKRYHQTLPLMGATRLASGKGQLFFSRVCILFFHYPDAGRVAPISACVFLQRVSDNSECPKIVSLLMPISPLLTCLSGVSTWQLAHVLRHQLICVSVLFRSNFPFCKERFCQTFRPRRKVCPIFSFWDGKLLYLHKHKYLLVKFLVNRLTCQLVY